MINKRITINWVVVMLFLMGGFFCGPAFSQTKASDDQDQIILLNDSASALEDSNPGLSKQLAQYADEKEKIWEENKNAGGPALPIPVTDKFIKQTQRRIKLLKAASIAIQTTYPLIARGLDKMANGMERAIENEK